jgi:hypothetical protein
MEQRTEDEEAIGFWLGGEVLCPDCWEGQHARHEGIIPPDDLIGLVTHCKLCDIQLWAYQAWKKEIEDSQKFPMKSPIRELRFQRGWTKKQLASEMGTSTRVVTIIEDGKMRLPDKFYRPLAKIGEDPGSIAIQQEDFMKWCRQFRSY